VKPAGFALSRSDLSLLLAMRVLILGQTLASLAFRHQFPTLRPTTCADHFQRLRPRHM